MAVIKDTNYRTFPFDIPLFKVVNRCMYYMCIVFLTLDIKVFGLILHLGVEWRYGCG